MDTGVWLCLYIDTDAANAEEPAIYGLVDLRSRTRFSSALTLDVIFVPLRFRTEDRFFRAGAVREGADQISGSKGASRL